MYIFLQQYWWLIVSLLGAILVFLLFVQGGNSLVYVYYIGNVRRCFLCFISFIL